MSKREISPKIVLSALLFQQTAMAAFGAILITFLNLADISQLVLSTRIVVYGLALAAILIGLAISARQMFPIYMAKLDTTVVKVWRKIGVEFTPVTILLVAFGAGISEELLFRGALQGFLVQHLSPWSGVLLASLLFGIVHASSVAYFVVATIIALLLGAVYQLTGSLLIVIIAHAVYDVWALKRLRVLLLESGNAPC